MEEPGAAAPRRRAPVGVGGGGLPHFPVPQPAQLAAGLTPPPGPICGASGGPGSRGAKLCCARLVRGGLDPDPTGAKCPGLGERSARVALGTPPPPLPPPPLPKTHSALAGTSHVNPGAITCAPPAAPPCLGLLGTAVAWAVLSPATASPEVAQRGSLAHPCCSLGGLVALGFVLPSPFPCCPGPPPLVFAALGVSQGLGSRWSPAAAWRSLAKPWSLPHFWCWWQQPRIVTGARGSQQPPPAPPSPPLPQAPIAAAAPSPAPGGMAVSSGASRCRPSPPSLSGGHCSPPPAFPLGCCRSGP